MTNYGERSVAISLFWLASPVNPRSLRAFVLSLLACEVISHFCFPALKTEIATFLATVLFVKAPLGGCERSAAISHLSKPRWGLRALGVSLRACEAISLLSVCERYNGEIASYLATVLFVKAPLGGCERRRFLSLRA